MDFGLRGKNVLVLASSKGLGRATAEAYARTGANVMISSRSVETLKQTAAEINEFAEGSIAWLPCDVTRPDDIKKLVDETAQRFGGLDVLVNNAGGPPPGKFEDLSEEDWDYAYNLNLMSTVRAIRYALPYLKVSKGKIVNITSISMKEPVEGLLLSNVYRMGITGLAKTLSKEFAEHGILINTVGPGRIDTERVQSLDKKAAEIENISEEEVRLRSADKIPLGRYGTPNEFANAILFLGSGLNTYITGQMFVVDGGLSKAY
ncbi:SDR family oxidoreductase [Evansella sp. AB-P1]|uniref:SDR family oxidoreductase n=1 Tax=Evansella sp. AB-P1 TaxID=3037653 RepID=UPI00241F5110|nr:SDR family oxidoreductase [Evansella sp. AB-P1]MDG5786079.1 SDR family oxidoreductase [Evansella sp. AB-P1]